MYRAVPLQCYSLYIMIMSWLPVGWLYWCFTAFWHILGNFGRSHLTQPHCSWASLLGSLPVLSAHSFASNWQLTFLNQQKGGSGCRNVFMTKSQRKNVLPDVRIEPTTVRIPGGRTSYRATAPSKASCSFYVKLSHYDTLIWVHFHGCQTALTDCPVSHNVLMKPLLIERLKILLHKKKQIKIWKTKTNLDITVLY